MVKRKVRAAPDDLSELDKVVEAQEEGVVVELFNMDGRSPLGFGIRVAGPDSERAASARRARAQEYVARQSLEPLSEDEEYLSGTKYLSRICVGFVGKAKLDGSFLQDREEDFFKLFQRFRFIRNQIDVGAANRESFLLSSEQSSETPSEEQPQTES